MTTGTIYVYVLDTLADWELGFALAEFHSGRYFTWPGEGYTVTTFGLTQEPVVTMGGLRIVPDRTVDEVVVEQAALLMLPGGATWGAPQHGPVLAKVPAFLAAGVPVAAICGATTGLAQAGVLNDRPHTSNDLGYLRATCPAYAGEAHYQAVPAVTAGDLITASGAAPLEFAYHIVKRLAVFSDETLDAWYKLYTTREPHYFFQLMQSLPLQPQA